MRHGHVVNNQKLPPALSTACPARQQPVPKPLVAVALHICMNLWWELFSVAKTAIGGWFPFMLQNMTMLLAIFITLYRTRSRVAAVTPAG
jgi:hypothetical protein